MIRLIKALIKKIRQAHCDHDCSSTIYTKAKANRTLYKGQMVDTTMVTFLNSQLYTTCVICDKEIEIK
jgi:hypothetical protein